MKREPSITQMLSGIGLRHERDEHSIATGQHRIYRGAEFLGSYTAHEAVELVKAVVEAEAFRR